MHHLDILACQTDVGLVEASVFVFDAHESLDHPHARQILLHDLIQPIQFLLH